MVGLAHPDQEDVGSFDELAKKGREGKPIPLKDVKEVGNRKEPLITLPETADLTKAIEVFGSGVHRVLVAKEGTTDVVGILTQLRLVNFFWENRQSFPDVDQLYPHLIKDLGIGSKSVLAINGDKPLASALELMNNEGVSSLPVLDAQNNVIGNISHVDVRVSHSLLSVCAHSVTDHQRSSSPSRPPSRSCDRPAYTSYPSSSPNAASTTAKTPSPSST